MVIVVLLPLVLFVIWAVRRRRKMLLAGLNVDRPVFRTEPPKRFSSTRRDHRL